MGDVAQIREHADVAGSDDAPVGTVEHVETGEIELTKRDPGAGGPHPFIPVDFARSVDGNTVRLDRPAEEVVREWSTA